jgi:hypothetical protein
VRPSIELPMAHRADPSDTIRRQWRARTRSRETQSVSAGQHRSRGSRTRRSRSPVRASSLTPRTDRRHPGAAITALGCQRARPSIVGVVTTTASVLVFSATLTMSSGSRLMPKSTVSPPTVSSVETSRNSANSRESVELTRILRSRNRGSAPVLRASRPGAAARPSSRRVSSGGRHTRRAGRRGHGPCPVFLLGDPDPKWLT